MSTGGLTEAGLTLYLNGLEDSGKRIRLDRYNFLNVGPEEEYNEEQRFGRAGRVEDSLVCNVMDPLP